MKYLLITACLIWKSAIAFAYNTDTLVINTSQSRLLTNRYFNELEDPRSNLSIKQVFNSNKFQSIQYQLPVLQYLKSATWLKFTLKNNSTEPVLTISTGSAVIDKFDLYYTDPASASMRHQVPDYSPGYSIVQNTRFIN